MANPNFDGIYSTHNIWRGDDETRCLTDDLDAIEADIAELQESQGASYTHPETHPASMITGLAEVATTGDYEDLANKPTIPAAYTHPSSHPASMITGLSEVATTGDYNDLENKPTIPAAYTHPASHPASMITGLASVATSGSYNDLADKPTIPTVPSSLPANGGNADTVDGKHAADFATAGHTHDYAASGHTHTPADIGAADASHTHSGYAASGHTHTAAALLAMAGALFGTNEIGGVEYSYGSGATSDLLATMAAWPQGLHTAYVIAGTTGAPPVSGESWRIIAHKTSDTIGWILAFGSSGSIFANYQNSATTYRGWRAIYEASPSPLWTGGANGGYYMTEGHTITPSKKLSECRNGWILLWSDYDVGGEANNTDFCTTIIPKRAYTGQVWNGAMWYCDVPSYAAGTATDSEVRVIKVLQIYDAKIVGTENNGAAPRNDVVLRAVYEF